MALPAPPPREEVLSRLSVQAQRRLYAPGGGTAINDVFLDLCLLEAWSEAHSITSAAFPQGLRNADGSIDPFVVGAVVDLCNGKAAGRHPNATDASGYAKAAATARSTLEKLATDNLRRRSEGAGAPTAALVVYSSPAATPWADIADGRTASDL